MKKIHRTIALGAALLFGATGCADLTVPNPNEADAERAIRTPGDIESLVAGSYRNVWIGTMAYDGIGLALSNMAFTHGSSAANSGMVFYSTIPRQPIANSVTATYYPNFAFPMQRVYRGLAAVADGLRALDDPEISGELGEARTRRARAFGRYVQGLGHASIAVLYDQGWIIDETVPTLEGTTPIEIAPVPAAQVMQAALGYFDDAIALASQGGFEAIPQTWTSEAMSPELLAQAASSMKARYRAALARTPAEAGAVNWQAVLDEIDAGVQDDLLTSHVYIRPNWWNNTASLYNSQQGASWSFVMYWLEGMADQSGSYQEWLSNPPGARTQNLDGEPFLIHTPDLRFPQGETLDEQRENPGTYYRIGPNLNGQWAQPGRGTWRWSYYADTQSRRNMAWLYDGAVDHIPEIGYHQQQLLAAEAHYHLGNFAEAAEIINETRTANGLNATDASGTNTSCVPRLPSGECGDLFEMLKWEKRMEAKLIGIYSAEGYFDSRRWGDLYEGTALEFPVPALQLEALRLPTYTFGGGGESSADRSTYDWPGEG